MRARLARNLGLCLVASCLLTPFLLVTTSALAKTKIRFASWDSSKLPWAEIIKDFAAAHPNIEVTYEFLNYDKLEVLFAAGSAPDVFFEGDFVGFSRLADKGVFKDLAPYYKASGLTPAMFNPWAMKAVTYGNKIVGIPWSVSNQGFLTYNRNHFSEAGVASPSEDWTLDDLVAAAKRLNRDTNGDGKPDFRGLWFDASYIINVVRSAGKEPFDEKTKQLELSTPEALRALKWCAALWTQHKVVEPAWDNYIKGKVAMCASNVPLATWLASASFVQKKVESGITFWPKDPVTGLRKFAIEHNPIVISANTKHPKESWQFAKWYAFEGGPRYVKQLMGVFNQVPALRSLANSAEYLKPDRSRIPETVDTATFIRGVEKYTVNPPALTNIDQALAVVTSTWADVLSSKMSVEQYAKRVDRSATEILRRSKK